LKKLCVCYRIIRRDRNYILGGFISIMKFEWDENKNKINIKKHKIPFEYAIHVFDDENRIEEYDKYHDEYEARYQIIGMVNEILFVVVTYIDDDKVRVISARKATIKERRKYYGNYYKDFR